MKKLAEMNGNEMKMYKIMIKSWGGTRETLLESMTYGEALEFCEANDWVMCFDGGYVWDLIIEEM